MRRSNAPAYSVVHDRIACTENGHTAYLGADGLWQRDIRNCPPMPEGRAAYLIGQLKEADSANVVR